MRLPTIIITFCFLFTFSIKASAGWVISEVSEDNYGNKNYQTTFIQNNIIRFETQSSIAIIDLKTSIITIIFSNYQLYWQGTIEDFKKGTLEVFEQKLQNIVATAEPEQKEIARDLIEQLKQENKNDADSVLIPARIDIKFTGKYDSINGFRAKKYHIYASDSLAETIWITESLKPYEDINLESMISFTNQLNPSAENRKVEGSDEYLNLIKNGLAVKSTKPFGPYGTLTTIVNSVIKTDINADFFEPPPLYRKAKLIEIMLMDDLTSPANSLKNEFNKAKNNPLYD